MPTIEDRLEAIEDHIAAMGASQDDALRRVDGLTAQLRAERQRVEA